MTRLPAILGRDLKSDVRLADPWVSRLHGELNEIDGTLVVRDLGSKHGIFVNGHRGTDSHVFQVIASPSGGRGDGAVPTLRTGGNGSPDLQGGEGQFPGVESRVSRRPRHRGLVFLMPLLGKVRPPPRLYGMPTGPWEMMPLVVSNVTMKSTS